MEKIVKYLQEKVNAMRTSVHEDEKEEPKKEQNIEVSTEHEAEKQEVKKEQTIEATAEQDTENEPMKVVIGNELRDVDSLSEHEVYDIIANACFQYQLGGYRVLTHCGTLKKNVIEVVDAWKETHIDNLSCDFALKLKELIESYDEHKESHTYEAATEMVGDLFDIKYKEVAKSYEVINGVEPTDEQIMETLANIRERELKEIEEEKSECVKL